MKNFLTMALAALAFGALALFTNTVNAQTVPVPAIDQALLQWDYTPADEALITNFTLERKAQACSGALGFAEIAQPAKAARFHLDAGLTRGATYCYRAFAVGPGIGGKSAASNTVEKIIPSAPVPPANLR